MGVFVEIIQLGVAGLAVFLFYRLLANHLHYVEIALRKLTDIIEKLNKNISDKL